jgi:hypothetical protein
MKLEKEGRAIKEILKIIEWMKMWQHGWNNAHGWYWKLRYTCLFWWVKCDHMNETILSDGIFNTK